MDWFSVLFGGGVVGIIGAFGILVRHWFKGKGAYEKESAEAAVHRAESQARIDDRRESVAIRELRRSQEVMQQDRQLDRKEIHDQREELQILQNKLALCQIDCARKDERIIALEDTVERLAQQLGVEYRKPPPLPPQLPPHEPHEEGEGNA